MIAGAPRPAGGAHDALRIVHDIPGRLRLRVPARSRTDGIADAIRGLAGVGSSAWSPATRSLLVLYRPDAIAPRAITDAVIRHARLAKDVAVEMPSSGRRVAAFDQTAVAGAVSELFGELDRQVSGVTRGLVGLAGLVPLALVVWAVRELTLGRPGPLRWSSALWYAHGLFRDYFPSANGD